MYKIWHCKIGYSSEQPLPPGSDAPMRSAVEKAFKRLTGSRDQFCFSGWNGRLSPGEQAVVENTAPIKRSAHKGMRISELMEVLGELQGKHGDIEVFIKDRFWNSPAVYETDRIMEVRETSVSWDDTEVCAVLYNY